MKRMIIACVVALNVSAVALAHEGHDEMNMGKDSMKAEASEMVTVKGEIIDMACYIDHNATGEKHAQCARTCIESGLPVGIKGENGKTYLLIGEHKPINKELVQYAAKTITVRGKAVSRDGFNMIENAEIVK
jgi:hypothetical protein